MTRISNNIKFYFIFISILLEKIHSSRIHKENFLNENFADKKLPYNVMYPNSTITLGDLHEYSSGECLNSYNCFLPYGVCLNTTTCMCMPEYANIYVEGHSVRELKCSYKRKRIVVAALLELFLPLGLGHFYVGHYTLGTTKFFYNFTLYIFCCFLYYKGTNNEVFTSMLVLCLLLSCVIPIWNIIDLFLFFTNTYKDGYGVAMS